MNGKSSASSKNAMAHSVLPEQWKRVSFFIVAGVALAFGIVHAISVRYVNDDAFISFRYARNFVDGLGLVFNAGEHVEGYTNFLWTMLVALGMKLRLDPVVFSLSLGICCYAFVLVLYAYASWRLHVSYGWRVHLIPLTSIALSFHRDFNVYATSGLETSMFTLFASAAFFILLFGKSDRASLLAGCVLCLAMLTRPDGVIFLAASLLYVALVFPKPIRRCALVLAPIILIFAPYWLWRMSYFGNFFPNSFYAKSIDLAYYEQGIRYAWMYLKTYYVFFCILPLAIMLAWAKGKDRAPLPKLATILGRLRSDETALHPILLGGLFIIPYAAFIVRIGGDFMFARMFIPITPFLFFLIEFLLNELFSRYPVPVFHLIVILTTAFRNDLFAEWNYDSISQITDECQLYTEEHLRQAQAQAEKLRRCFGGLPVTIAFTGTMARIIYYADIPVAIEASTGLTDSTIAHMSLEQRGRPGHEKAAPWPYLRRRKVNFCLKKPSEIDPAALDFISFGGVTAQIVVYDGTLMDRLASNPEISFKRMSVFLDRYIGQMSTLSRDRVESDYERLREYYFNFTKDPQREAAFLQYLSSAK